MQKGWCNRMYQTDLSVTMGKLKLKNPVMPASGTYGYLGENANLFPMEALGAIVIKSVHYHPRSGNPMPRIVETVGGMINAVGIPSYGLDRFLKDQLPELSTLNTPLILSIAGSEADEYALAAERIGNDERIAALELNLSCPNVGSGLAFSADPETIRTLLRDVRRKTAYPLLVKLSPNVTDINVTARAAEEAGADALVLSNTFMSMKIDIKRQAPALGNHHGGLSGPCIKPINMHLVYTAYQAVKIPIIACGGITCWEDAVEYILAGASAVQVGSANFARPDLMPEIVDGIDRYLVSCGETRLSDICGRAHQ